MLGARSQPGRQLRVKAVQQNMNWLNWLVIALGLLAALLLVASIYGASRWEAGTRKLETLLEAGRRPVTRARFALTELEGLPAPVQRYFRVALREGQPTPWEGRWWDYVTHDGMRVPMRGEVAWHLPTGTRPYWRGRVTKLEYEYAQ